MVNETIALFIPLLLAVVTGLSSFLREDVDLESAVDKQRPSFPGVLLWFLPPLGRFSVIHISNILLLLIGIRLVKNVAEEFQTAVVGSIVLGLFLVILPMIEIRPFDQVLDETSSGWFYPRSYYYHLISVTFLALYFFGFVEIQARIVNFLVIRGFSIGGDTIWLLNRFLGIVGFPSIVIGFIAFYFSMACLHDEIQQISHKK